MYMDSEYADTLIRFADEITQKSGSVHELRVRIEKSIHPVVKNELFKFYKKTSALELATFLRMQTIARPRRLWA